MQYEANQKLEAAQHLYHAYLSKNLPLWDLLRPQVPGFDKLLLFCYPEEQWNIADWFQLHFLLQWNSMHIRVTSLPASPKGNSYFI